MPYTKEILRAQIDEYLKTHQLKRVPFHFIFICKKDEKLREFIEDPSTTFGTSFSQRLYNIYHDIQESPKCAYEKCNNEVQFLDFERGYKETCSKWCTNYVKYGCKSTFGTKEQHEKAQQTLLEKTGCKSGYANPKTAEKIHKTMVEKYGTIFQKTPEFKEKFKATNLARYGVEHYGSTQKAIAQRMESNRRNHNGMLYQQTEAARRLLSTNYKENNLKEKSARGRREAYFRRLSEYADEAGYELLFSKDEYKGNCDENKKWRKYPFRCKSCGYEFELILGNIIRDGINCPNCSKKTKSQVQHRLLEKLREEYPNLTFIEDEARVLDGKKQIDIYCEEKKFGVEYNGNCWHAQKFNNKGRDYHFEKFKQFEKHELNVLSFWSDEFDKKSDAILDMTSLFLGTQPAEVYRTFTYEQIDKLSDDLMERFKDRCFYEISAKDKFIVVKAEDDVIAILKINHGIVDEIVYFKHYNFEDTFKDYTEPLKFKLDNRLLPYYRLFFKDRVKLVGSIEPKFYLLAKNKRSALHDNLEIVDFDKQDIIWSYGESLFELNQSSNEKNLREIEGFLNESSFEFKKTIEKFEFKNKLGECLTSSMSVFKLASPIQPVELRYVDSSQFPLDNSKWGPGYCGTSSSFFASLSKKKQKEGTRVIFIKDYEIEEENSFKDSNGTDIDGYRRKWEVLKSTILTACGKTKTKIYARDCEVREVPKAEEQAFLQRCCFYGARGSSLALGLYLKRDRGELKKGTLVLLATFGLNFYGNKKHKTDPKVEVLRVATCLNVQVVGGASKIFSHFIKDYPALTVVRAGQKVEIPVDKVVYYVDADHWSGTGMKAQGYELKEWITNGFHNIALEDIDIPGLKARRGEMFLRRPTLHKEIVELMKQHKVISIGTAGTLVYEL